MNTARWCSLVCVIGIILIGIGLWKITWAASLIFFGFVLITLAVANYAE